MKRLFIIAALAAGVATVKADESAFQLSLTPGAAIHSKTTQINGVSLGIWGENPQHSFNLGFVNGSSGDSSGFSVAVIGNYAESYGGIQWGMINHTSKRFVGWQDGLINHDGGYFKGLETGLVNVAHDAHGLQFGVINYAQKMHGVQIGIINVIASSPWFTDQGLNTLSKGFPIFNWSF